MPTWPAPLDDSYDFAALANLQFFEQAIWCRGLDTSAFVSAINTGDDAQLASLYAAWQNAVDTACGSYVPAGYDPSAHAPTDAPPWLNLATCLTTAGFTGPSWRRDCRRIVGTEADAGDAEGNPALTGQRAFVIADTAIREHDGSSWAIIPPAGTLADPLSSESAAPDAAVSGPMQAGDFIGWWIFAQLKAVLQQLNTTLGNVGDPNNLGIANAQFQKEYSILDLTSWASAKADVDTNWPPVIPVGVVDQLLLSNSAGSWDAFPEWTAEAVVVGSVWTQPANTTLFPSTKEIWIGAVAPGYTFDGTGYAGLTDSVWWKLATSGPGDTNPNLVSTEFPDTTIQPAWCADPTGSGSERSGFEVLKQIAVFRWDFGDFA